MCEQNKLGMVDVDLLRCLSCDLIPKLLIEKYLVEICRSQNVEFEPDQTVMAQDEFWTIGQRYVQHPPVNDEKRPPPPPSTGGASSTGGGGGGGLANFSNIPSAQPSAPEVICFYFSLKRFLLIKKTLLSINILHNCNSLKNHLRLIQQ
jgi:hypothetical protein